MDSDQEEREPTLGVLRDVQVDLQNSVANILKDNALLRAEITEVKSSLRAQERDFGKTKESLERLTTENESLRNELRQTKNDQSKQVEELQNLWSAMDDLEQYTRKNSLEITGVPESCYSSTEEVVMKVAHLLNVDISPTNIEFSYELKRKGASYSSIIIKFISHKAKTKLYKERKNLKNVNLVDLFPNFSSASNPGRISLMRPSRITGDTCSEWQMK